MAKILSNKEKKYLITRNLHEIFGEEKLEKILEERDVTIYWRVATNAEPHFSDLVPMVKIADFLRAGCTVIIGFTDLHLYCEKEEMLDMQTKYCKYAIVTMLWVMEVPLKKLKFFQGDEYEFSLKQHLECRQLFKYAIKGDTEMGKQTKKAVLFNQVMQVLDEEYLNVDAQFGGADKREIFSFAEKYLPVLGYEKRIHLMNSTHPGLSGVKMPSSKKYHKIYLLDSQATIERKLKKFFCKPGNVTDNYLLYFTKHVIFVLFKAGEAFMLDRTEENGGNIYFRKYEDLEAAFAAKKVDPADLKAAIARYLNKLLVPIRDLFEDPRLLELHETLYPRNQTTAKEEIVEVAASEVENDGLSRLDLRIGKVIRAYRHTNAEKLCVLKINVGQYSPKTVIIKFTNFEKLEKLQGCLVVVLCNMEPYNIRGIEAEAIVLCAINADQTVCEPIIPSRGSVVGERVTVEGFETGIPDLEVKKKMWTKNKTLVQTNADGEVVWKGLLLVVKSGGAMTSHLVNSSII